MQHSKCCVVSQPPWVQIPALPPLPPGPIGAGRFCYACLTCGPGRLECRWAAARPRAVRAACRCLWPRWCSGRRRPRPPARLGDLTSFGAAPRSPPVPSGPSGALHTGGAFAADVARRVDSLSGQALPPPTGTGAWPSGPSGALHTSGAFAAAVAWRVVSKPGRAPPPPFNFARNSPAACSNIEFASLELQCFRMVSKSDRRKLCATCGQRGPCCRLRVLGSDSPAIPALVIPEAVGVLQH